MLKKTISYTDYNDVKRTEDFYFNLTKAEVVEMELGTIGGFTEMLKKIIEAKDYPAIVKVIKDIILLAYGEKSPDGKHFVKSDEISAAFSQTEAYTELFMELSTDAEAASKFVNGIIPQESKALSEPVAAAG